MSSSIVSFKRRVWSLPPVLLLAAGLGSQSMEIQLARPAAISTGRLASLAGSGGTLAVLGGMRAVVAGGFWLRANLAWQSQKSAETTALLYLTVAADDKTWYFWANGARMMAYDLPEWRSQGVPAVVRQRIREEQASAALSFLKRGLQSGGQPADFHIEAANIHLRALGDREGAAHLFRLAAEQPGAPFYAARIHAELLRELGRPKEAQAWLEQILPRLPADDPSARREVVLKRIKELEQLAARK